MPEEITINIQEFMKNIFPFLQTDENCSCSYDFDKDGNLLETTHFMIHDKEWSEVKIILHNIKK